MFGFLVVVFAFVVVFVFCFCILMSITSFGIFGMGKLRQAVDGSQCLKRLSGISSDTDRGVYLRQPVIREITQPTSL